MVKQKKLRSPTRDLDFDISFSDSISELAKQNPLPDPVLVDYYERFGRRHIWLNFDIENTLLDWCYSIMQWNKEDYGIPIEKRKPIIVYIHTNGGEVSSCLNFVDVIQKSKTPVYTVCLGNAYSAGFLILMSGHRRFCFKHSSALLHSGSFGVIDSTDKIFDVIDFQKKVESKIESLVLEKTTISQELYKQNYKKEWYMDSSEMLENGVVDEIIEDLSAIF